jgi:DNA-binding protein HU-beta
MNKQEIVSAISTSADLTKKDAEKFLSAFENVITQALAEGKKVQLVGFVTIDVVERAEREGRNPQSGQPMKIAASKAPRFKAGKSLRDAVNGK